MAGQAMTRRAALGLGLGAAAAMAATPRVRAQAMARRPLGEGFVSTLSDGYLTLGPATGLAPEADAAEVAALFAEAGLDPASVRPPLNVTLLEIGGRTILFDAGSGPRFQDSAGRLLAALEGAGIAPDAVTDVVFTHAHPDHLGGVLDDFDEIAFPEAAYHIGRAEFDFWRSEGAPAAVGPERESFVVGAQARLEAIAERTKMIEPGAEVLPGIEAVATHGHTPGHLSFAIHAGEGLMVIGDAIAHPVLSFRRPLWPAGMDQDRAMAAETRARLLDRLAADRMAFVAYHLPEPGFGHVERAGEAYALAA